MGEPNRDEAWDLGAPFCGGCQSTCPQERETLGEVGVARIPGPLPSSRHRNDTAPDTRRGVGGLA